MTASDWQDALAWRVIELIREANRGHWPENIWQWKRVAHRFGVTLCIVPPEVLAEPLLRQNVLYLPRLRHSPDKLCRFLTHELSEACLQWEGEPPYCYSPPDPTSLIRHHIAFRVECQVSFL